MGLTVRGARRRLVWLLVLPFLAFSTPRPVWMAVGGVLTGLGLWIRGWSAGTIRKDRRLTVEGPYSFTRNPLYVGSLLLGVGVGIAGGHWIWPVLFLAFFAAVYPRTMVAEAYRLAELFPERYPRYAAHVPAFLPRLTPYRSERAPEGPEASPTPDAEEDGGFRWARFVRNKEWEAVLGAFAAYAFLVAKALLRE